MSSVVPHRRYTVDEFVRLEQYSNVRHEFLDGQIYAMAGGTPEHGTFAANVISLLVAQLRDRPCRVQTSDVRIRVQATGLDTYPDVSVVCGREERDGDDVNAIVNPSLVVEVLSESTDAYDRGEKLDHYKQIPSLHAVVFIAHDEHRVDVVQRAADGAWTMMSFRDGESAALTGLGCHLPVAEVYRDALATA